MKVVFVVGLPASGKTTWCANQVKALAAQGIKGQLIDDPESPALIEAGLVRLRTEHVDVVFVPHPAFCEDMALATVQVLVSKLGISREDVFFENNPQQCLRNARLRPEKTTVDVIHLLSQIYRPPPDRALPVFDGA
jgi:hypothetical protein